MTKSSRHTPLWQLRLPGQTAPSFLFGTMHVRDKRAFYLEPILLEKISECEAFAGEMNLDEANDTLQALDTLLRQNADWTEQIPPARLEKLRRMIRKSTGLDILSYARFPPEFLISLITEAVFVSDMPLALDAYLWEKAKAQGKHMLGIERMEEQMAVLEQLDTQDQLRSLLALGRNIGKFRRNLLDLTRLYASGNIHELYRRTRKSTGKYRKILLHQRNARMADRITTICLQQPTFCAIGAAHLSGKIGVLHLLNQAGVETRPIPLPLPAHSR